MNERAWQNLSPGARSQYQAEIAKHEAAQRDLAQRQMLKYLQQNVWTTTTSASNTNIGGALGQAAPAAPAAPLTKALVAGPIVGWRLWQIADGRLKSITHPYVWQPGVPSAGHGAAPGTSSGIYAMKRREALLSEGYVGQVIHGEVALWGRVIEHEHGYRAEYAYPLRLHWPRPMPGFPEPHGIKDLYTTLAEAYGCELVRDSAWTS